MRNFVSLEEIREKCEDNTLVRKIRTLTDNIKNSDDKTKDKEIEKIIPDVRKVIEAVLPNGKKAKPQYIKQYIEELMKQNPSSEGADDIVESPPPAERPNNNLESSSPGEEPSNNLESAPPVEGPNNNLESNPPGEEPSNNLESAPPAEGPNNNLESNSPDEEPSEKIKNKTEAERSAIYVDEEKAKELDYAKARIAEQEKIISVLQKKVENLEEQLKNALKETDKKNPLSQIPGFGELLNSCNERVTVTINKNLLSKVTKFVDDNSLIKLESIIRDGCDLNSAIAQNVLLAFIHQNSLL